LVRMRGPPVPARSDFDETLTAADRQYGAEPTTGVTVGRRGHYAAPKGRGRGRAAGETPH